MSMKSRSPSECPIEHFDFCGPLCEHVRFCTACIECYGLCEAHAHDPSLSVRWACDVEASGDNKDDKGVPDVTWVAGDDGLPETMRWEFSAELVGGEAFARFRDDATGHTNYFRSVSLTDEQRAAWNPRESYPYGVAWRNISTEG